MGGFCQRCYSEDGVRSIRSVKDGDYVYEMLCRKCSARDYDDTYGCPECTAAASVVGTFREEVKTWTLLPHCHKSHLLKRLDEIEKALDG